MMPYYVGSTFTPILYIGKRLNLKDEDFYAVFPCWMSLSTLLPCEICRWAGAAAAGVWETAVCGSIRRRLVRRPAAVHSLIVGNQEDGAVVETGLRDAGGWAPERGGGGDGSRPRQQEDHRHTTAEEGKNSNHATTLDQQPRGVLTYPGGVEFNDDDISYDCSSMSSSMMPEEKSSNQSSSRTRTRTSLKKRSSRFQQHRIGEIIICP